MKKEDESVNMFDCIEDEIDCAIGTFELDKVVQNGYNDKEEIDTIDTKLDYSIAPEMSIEDMDASDMIAAEREIMANPLFDDELIDEAIGNDELSVSDYEENFNEEIEEDE